MIYTVPPLLQLDSHALVLVVPLDVLDLHGLPFCLPGLSPSSGNGVLGRDLYYAGRHVRMHTTYCSLGDPE